ncbi:MAG: response regulator [Desulfobulbaceae bacterium]|uniref:Response regulator n=1 Tax=Candidatus Desulfobia pelagia TaxID=2841692 RepID=A0A8J6NF70_9BACT|nr:response regulator [Candidatus Desulfobia pelagia]
MAGILVIDDEESIRILLKKILEREGHSVAMAPNGKVGLEMQSQQAADVVITDIFMPEKEGMEVIMELRRNFPEVKIVAMSGGDRKGNMDFLGMTEKLGAHKTLKKPFTLNDVLEVVQSVL